MKLKEDAKAYHLYLYGDKKTPEKQTSIIHFPGGYIEVTRTTDNNYWAHVKVNNGQIEDSQVHTSKAGKIERIRYDTPEGVKTITENTDHFAILISTEDK